MAAAEKKKRELTPWRIYRVEPGDEDGNSTTLTLQSEEEYPGLAHAEKVCDELAADEIGTRFVAAKCGRVHLAEEVRTVEVRKS